MRHYVWHYVDIDIGEGNGNPLIILAGEIPWTEEPEGLLSLRLQRVGHYLATDYSCRQGYMIQRDFSLGRERVKNHLSMWVQTKKNVKCKISKGELNKWYFEDVIFKVRLNSREVLWGFDVSAYPAKETLRASKMGKDMCDELQWSQLSLCTVTRVDKGD